MAINKKYFKQRTLMIFDMLICLICALIMGIFFYKIELIRNIKMEIMVVSIILLPLTMVVSIILFSGYPKGQKMNDKQFNRCILSVFLGIIIYVLYDIIFACYEVAMYKAVTSLMASCFIVQSRLIFKKNVLRSVRK